MTAPAQMFRNDDPAWGGKTYAPRRPAWHMKCCERHRVAVAYEQPGWWRATAHDEKGRPVYVTGGRTRRHAETNALNGVGAQMTGPAHASVFGGLLEGDGPA